MIPLWQRTFPVFRNLAVSIKKSQGIKFPTPAQEMVPSGAGMASLSLARPRRALSRVLNTFSWFILFKVQKYIKTKLFLHDTSCS